MEEDINGWLVAAHWLLVVIAIVAFKICYDIITEKKSMMMGVRDFGITPEDSSEAAKMLVDYLHGATDGDKRHNDECGQAGCDGYPILRKSKDIATLVHCAHKAGGRLVARRVERKDIECGENTVLEVKKRLTELDIERAKRVDRKYRR